MTREIPLTRGYVAIIDAADYELVSKFKWCASLNSGGNPYAISHGNRLMHRLLLHAQKGMQVDHINGNSLDNRRANLRLCTPQENRANMKMRRGNRSGFKGVSECPYKIYEARIMNKRLGRFKCPIEAARAYDAAALERWGEFALLNFPTHNSAQSATG